MTFGERVAAVRKEQKVSQTQLGKRAGMSGDMLGKYERGEMKPNIETAQKIANALGVSLDYLVGDGKSQVMDKKMLSRIEEINAMPKDLKEYVLHFIDMSIRDAKTRKAYAG